MKNTLFGRLGRTVKDNGLALVLMVAVVAAGAFSYNTISRINKQLENQKLQNIETTPQPQPTDEVQDVQKPQTNVPLPSPTQKPDRSRRTKPEDPKEDAEEAPTKPNFVLPVTGKIYAAFSGDELVYNRTLDDWRTHNGIDITARKGDGVHAGADGVVKAVYDDGMLGKVVEIDHGDYVAKYCGLAEKVFVKEGDSVEQNRTIGSVGEISMEISEESHIHLEVFKDGAAVNPDTLLK